MPLKARSLIHSLRYYHREAPIAVSILSRLAIFTNRSQNYANNMFKLVTVCTKNAVNLPTAATSCRVTGRWIWSIKPRDVNISGRITTASTAIAAIISIKIPAHPTSNCQSVVIFWWGLSGEAARSLRSCWGCWSRVVSSDNMSVC